jgi:predicted SprT family Zn-dependent metalloprotease
VTHAPRSAEMRGLSAKLEAALVRELADTYRHVAGAIFKGALRPPAIELVDARSRLGRFVADTRTIEISRPLVLESPWGVVVEVLKHEMAHQYVWEVLGEEDEAPHGPRFRAVCARLGIDGSPVGRPEPTAAHDPERERVAEKIARLLALAESPNAHEAEAAMAAAQRLLLTHNIELVRSRAARGYGWRHLGTPSGRTQEHERTLSLLLSQYFFVDAIWIPVYRPAEGTRASVLEICGTPENLEIAEYVHAYLISTAERLWAEHKRDHGIRGNKERRTFLAGVMQGMADKLARESKKNAEAGLVWVADGDLATYFRARHPYVRNVRYSGQARSEAYARGREKGRNIVIHKGISSKTESRGRLLGRGPS